MSPRTVLVLGNGGREHALALALRRDPAVEAVHVAPGQSFERVTIDERGQHRYYPLYYTLSR